MKVYRAVYIVAVLAFAVTNFPSAGILGMYARFASLIFLAVALLAAIGSAHHRSVINVLGVVGLLFGWCLTTAFWTDNFWLTVTKTVLVGSTVVGLFLGGSYFAAKADSKKNPFAPLGLILVITVLSSAPYLLAGSGFNSGNFQGATGNPNTLGALIAFSSPWLVIEMSNGTPSKRRKIGLVLLAGFAGLMLFLSYSRSSLGAATILLIFVLQISRPAKRLLYLYAAVLSLVLVFAVAPNIFSFMNTQVIHKRSETITASRDEQISSSWEAAKRGGVLGLGFGVSAGQSRYWNFGTFSATSREKGNSQLAIVEETGVVGFLLYLGLLFTLAFSIYKSMYRSGKAKRDFALLTMGFLFAAIFHSLFEAWFFSIGPETAFFWATLGLAFGHLGRPIAVASVPQFTGTNVTLAPRG